MPVIDLLPGNADFQVSTVTFNLIEDDDFSDADYTEFLRERPHITGIFLWISTALWNWPMLLRHLETRNNLQAVSLWIRNNLCGANVETILQTLQRNTNILGFKSLGEFVAIDTLVPFLNAATQITKLALMGVVMSRDGNANGGPALLAASLMGMTNLQSLELSIAHPEYLVAIFDALRQNTSLLTLNVWEQKLLGSRVAVDSFQKLMRTTSTIRELVMDCSVLFRSRDIILEVAKRNFSLRVVRAEHFSSRNDLLNGDDRRLLQFYANRNERMDEWLDHPAESVPNKHLWANVLTVASQGDPSVLFRSLIAISGDLAPSKRTRKRKRPAYYDPS